MPRWRNGSRRGLKIPWSVMTVRVRLPLSVQQLFDYATRTITAYARMRRDDRQVIVRKTTVGNDGADCKVLSRYLPPAVAKRVSFLLKYFNIWNIAACIVAYFLQLGMGAVLGTNQNKWLKIGFIIPGIGLLVQLVYLFYCMFYIMFDEE